LSFEVAGVEDFHCAPQQFLEFAPFDSRPSMNEILTLYGHNGYLFVYLKLAMI
jgi:hypothetical protein